MNLQLFRLLLAFSDDLIKTPAMDVEVMARYYIERAFYIGRDVGLAERKDTDYGTWHPPGDDFSSGSGSEL